MQEVEQLRKNKLEIDQQLRNLHGSATGQMPSFQPTRRGMDEGPGGRGSRGGMSRGRGRGGRGPPRHNMGKCIFIYIFQYLKSTTNHVEELNEICPKPIVQLLTLLTQA